MNHSDAGPSRSTTALAKIPSAIPNRNSTNSKGDKSRQYEKNDTPNAAEASTSTTASATELVAMLLATSPVTYSEIESGVANRFRKLRDQTSSRKVVVTPCITREKKSHKSTAPSSAGTKSKVAFATEFR